MAIFNPANTTDPDYPVPSLGFAQHQCNSGQPVMGQQSWYWNGQAVMPVGQSGAWGGTAPQANAMADSRRFDTMPGMQPQGFGFNQLAEQSRRNMPVLPPAPAQPAGASSPWAQQAAAVPQQFVAQPMIPQNQLACSQPAYSVYPNQPYDRYAALATLRPSIDKSQGAWNASTQPITQVPPVVNWGAAQQQMQYPGTVQQAYAPMTYPQQAVQPVQLNWEQIALSNFGK